GFGGMAPLLQPVMPGLVPGIHVLLSFLGAKDVDGRDKPGQDADRPTSASPIRLQAVGEFPSLASSAVMRAFSASFSSRASRAMSLTTSNSSRLTTSRSRRNFSAWLRTTVSTSRLTPCAAPAASFISRPISSKNRLVVWVISGILPARGEVRQWRSLRRGSSPLLATKRRLPCHVPVSLRSYRLPNQRTEKPE